MMAPPFSFLTIDVTLSKTSATTCIKSGRVSINVTERYVVKLQSGTAEQRSTPYSRVENPGEATWWPGAQELKCSQKKER